MKITKLDTGVTAIEIDPTKEYMFIVDVDSGIESCNFRWENGTILFKLPGSEIQIVEK